MSEKTRGAEIREHPARMLQSIQNLTMLPGPVVAQGRSEREFGAEGGVVESAAQIKQERDEYKEQVLRVRAEFANYQKRAKEQAKSDEKYAIGPLAARPARAVGQSGYRAIERFGPQALRV